MKKFLNASIIPLKQETYLSLIIFLAPFLYFLSGINVDMYSPSMPTMTTYFNATIVATKNTISMNVFGWAIGAFAFGILIDSFGRKKILLIGLSLYVLASLGAPFCSSIHALLLIRFIQGFSIASILGARVLIVDHLSGHRYTVAILYTSIGYGMGPIIGPFIGGFLQHYWGWRANFYVLSGVSVVILLAVLLFIKESISVRHPLKLSSIAKRCFSVISHKKFMAGALIGGITQIQLMLYATLGPFIVENLLHQTAIVYGNSALLVGASYLTGNLVNRLLLRYISPKQICDAGYVILVVSLLVALLFALTSKIELTTLMLPIFLTCVSAGFIFPNVLGMNLKQFSHSIGIAMAVQSAFLLLLSAVGILLISYVHVVELFQLFYILLGLAFVEIMIFFGFYRGIFSEKAMLPQSLETTHK